MSDPAHRSQFQAIMDRYRQVPWRRALRAALRTRRRGSLLLPERLEGAVYGHLVGDALGVPYESQQPDAIGEVRWRGGGPHRQPPGTWSDDGALMLALLDSLLEVGFDPEDQGRRALAWRTHGRYAPRGLVFDIGRATSAALDRIAAGMPASGAGAVDALGNGSLMRILPLPLVMRATEAPDLVLMAARASRVTHGSAEAQLACALYALVVRQLLGGERDRPAALAAAERELRACCSSRGLPGSRKASGPAAARAALDAFMAWSARSGSGRAVDTFWTAWDAFAGSTSYREAVVRAVATGHDTDTTAGVAGGLAGVYWGVDAVPAEWRHGLRDRHIARRLVDRLIASDEAGWDGEPWRTSTSYPLRVDQVDLAPVGGKRGGSVGITSLPGRRYVGYHTGAHWRDLDTDAARLHDLGVEVMLLLVEDRELRRCRVADMGELMPAHGVEVVRFPIRNPLLPDDDASFRSVVTDLVDRVRAGQSIAIACRGGLDRSGMAAGCVLREAGLDADEAIERVHRARAGSLTLPDQQAYVRRWPPGGLPAS